MYFFQFLCGAALVWGLTGCGGTITTSPTLPKGPVDFQYEMQGDTYFLSQLFGKPIVLVLVRTSEVTNEMQLDQIQKSYARWRAHVHVLVLTIAENEAPMLDMFVEFHDYPFHIGIAPAMVAQGQSALGIVPTVPTTYLIAADGQVQQVLPGALNGEKLNNELRSINFIP